MTRQELTWANEGRNGYFKAPNVGELLESMAQLEELVKQRNGTKG